MKKIFKALPKEGECFTYLCDQFPGLSEAKLKEGVFVGPDIRKMMKDDNFETKMETNERKAWESFKLVITSFLGNKKDPNYKFIVEEMTKNFKILGCNMSLKVHFLDSHLDCFLENFGAVNEEQATREVFWDGPRNFEPWTTPETVPPPPNFRTTPSGGHLTNDVRFNMHQTHIHGGSSVELGLEPGALRYQSRDLATRPPLSE
ncbi:hypothetical protein AVEN_31300-1 [Araneus ventricosus]|uniref:Uncharacterized protein n=1 Tax=Araneus ventricosus TaxID=182803 RepID=A0A4Y2GAC1_ARAVE|nr:hypothetical protein AVEN_31300-1 [Araneus ventricosus]